MITLAKNPHGILATRTIDNDTHLTCQAAAVLVARDIYTEALKHDAPAATLDDVCDALPQVTPKVFKTTGTAPTLAAALLPAVADRLWAFTVIEHARADVGSDYRYILDFLADGLKRGADPHKVRAEVPRVIKRLRIQHTITAATDAITTAVTGALTGLTTHPRDVAELLHQAIDDASAEHLARPDVGDMSLNKAESCEAFSTAVYAMKRALSLSPDPQGTASGLRTALGMVIDEA